MASSEPEGSGAALPAGLGDDGRGDARGSPALDSYLARLARREPASEEDEQRLIAAAKAGDDRARERLVEAYLPRIASIAADYRSHAGLSRVELLQEGVVGLLRAVERYEPGRGAAFWAYASWWVRQAIQGLVAELARPLVLSDRALRSLSRLRDASAELAREGNADPGPAELAERAGIEIEQVRRLLAADRAARSLEEPAPGPDAATGPFGDLIADPLAEGEYERVLDRIEAQELAALLSALSPREREILAARSGASGPPATLAELAERHGVSVERVRQIEERARAKARRAAASAGAL